MGSGASITDLSADELGTAVGNLGKAYESAKQEVVDNGISGKILWSSVQDDEVQFKSFIAENMNVTRPLHQTVLFSNYCTYLNSDGNQKSAAVQLDIRETLQRPPNLILSELFQIQGIKLDPENVAGAVDDIAAAIRASIGEGKSSDGVSTFDCFISYRVNTDKVIAESLYDKLVNKGFSPFLDKFKLKNGMAWKDGFLHGLQGSKCFVSLTSRGALALCRDKSINHAGDNYLLEIETALRYMQASGNNAYIIPVHIGEVIMVEGSPALRKFADFSSSLYADTVGPSAGPSLEAQKKAEDDLQAGAEIRAKAEQEARQIREAALRDAAATVAAASALKEKSDKDAKAALELRTKAERDAKAAASAASTPAPALAAALKARAVEQQALTSERAGNNNHRNGYFVRRWDDGDVHAGSVDASGKKEGPGVMRFWNVFVMKGVGGKVLHRNNVGDVYEGEYMNDFRSGYGIHSRSDGSVVYAGSWKDGVPAPALGTAQTFAEAVPASRHCLKLHQLQPSVRTRAHACDVCKKTITTKCWYCEGCDYDVCADCTAFDGTRKLGSGEGASLYYCGRKLGKAAIPGSDGQCGPNNGPQCKACQVHQKIVKSACG